MPLVRARSAAASGSAVLLLLSTGCGRVGYELLDGDHALGAGRGSTATGGDRGSDASASGGNGAVKPDGGARGGAGGRGGSAGSANADATPGAGGAATGGVGGAGGAASGSGGVSVGDAAITGTGGSATLGKPPADCAAGVTLGKLWTFATSDAWYFSAPAGTTGAMTIVSSPGDLDSGSAEFDVTAVGSDVRSWLRFDSPQPNLSGHTAHGAIWLDSDAAVTVKLFALTNDGSIWLDGGTLTLKPHAWTCQKLEFDAPAYASAAYDANAVRSIGFELGSLVPFRVYIDDVGY